MPLVLATGGKKPVNTTDGGLGGTGGTGEVGFDGGPGSYVPILEPDPTIPGWENSGGDGGGAGGPASPGGIVSEAGTPNFWPGGGDNDPPDYPMRGGTGGAHGTNDGVILDLWKGKSTGQYTEAPPPEEIEYLELGGGGGGNADKGDDYDASDASSGEPDDGYPTRSGGPIGDGQHGGIVLHYTSTIDGATMEALFPPSGSEENWIVPADFDDTAVYTVGARSGNMVSECIGGGGTGADFPPGTVDKMPGGGGGEYQRDVHTVAVGQSVPYYLGRGGTATVVDENDEAYGEDGEDTWIETPDPIFCEEGTDEEPEYLPECEMELSVYEIDGVTKAWTAGTATDHATPYLMPTQNYAAQEVDPVAGAVTIGQVEVSIADVRQTPGDQTTGFVTEKLSDGGLGAIYGRRCRLALGKASGNAVIVADGPAGPPRMDGSYAGYRWTIRDTRDVERKVRAFTKSSTTVMPLGVREQFGYRGATNPVPATFKVEIALGGTSGSEAAIGSTTHAFFELLTSEPWYDDLMREAMEAEPSGEADTPTTVGEWFTDATDPPDRELKARHWLHKKAAIYWRYPAGEWHVISDLYAATIIDVPTGDEFIPDQAGVVSGPPLLVEIDDSDPDNPFVLKIRVQAYPEPAPLASIPGFFGDNNADKDFPEADDAVEIMIVYNGAPTPKYPLHIGGIPGSMTAGTLLCRLYSGYYSPRDPVTDAIVPTGIRWDGDSLAQMTEPVMLRVTEPTNDLRDWAEKYIYAPSGFFPALDSDGRISVLSQIPPESSAGLPTVNDAAAEPSPDWNAGDRVVNVLSFTYARYYQPNAPEASADWISERQVVIEYDDVDSIAMHGSQVVDFDALAFGAFGTASGAADPELEEVGRTLAGDRKLYLFDRYRNAAQTIRVNVRRSEVEDVRVGGWVVIDLSWIPDYVTQLRGGLFMGQVVGISDINCAWRELLVEQAVPVTDES